MINLQKMLDYDIDYFKGSSAFQIAEKYFEIKRYNLAAKEYRKCFEYYLILAFSLLELHKQGLLLLRSLVALPDQFVGLHYPLLFLETYYL